MVVLRVPLARPLPAPIRRRAGTLPAPALNRMPPVIRRSRKEVPASSAWLLRSPCGTVGLGAAAQRKSIQQLALERLSSLVEVIPEIHAGSPAAVLRVMQEPPHPSSADVDELDAAILAGRLPIRMRGWRHGFHRLESMTGW